MPLVAYSDSEEDDEPRAKRAKPGLPALPSSFRDLYSSTVRSSTQDDPTLHAGRKRAVPHIEGNWPAHIYLEWHPNADEQELLTSLLEHGRGRKAHSLLRNELGISLPLHVSLSRPLVLKTEEKDVFLSSLRQAVPTGKFEPFTRCPTRLRWHPNEDGTREFLVLQLSVLEHDNTLSRLLQVCNQIAAGFGQPVLYTSQDKSATDQFHISIGWALPRDLDTISNAIDLPSSLDEKMKALVFTFIEVKVRIGQDVTTLPFTLKHTTARSLFS